MKVLIVINDLNTGGAERLLADTIPYMNKKGVRTDLLLLNGYPYPFLQQLEKHKGCHIYKLSEGSVYNPILIFKIIPYLRKYDIAHVHLFPCLYYVALAKLLSFSKIKLVFTEHSTNNQRREVMFFRWTDHVIYRQYHTLVTISTEVKLFLKRHLGKLPTPFKTINNGVDIEKFRQAKPAKREDFGIQENENIIIHVARFTPQKDPATLVRAIPYLKDPAAVLFVGKGVEIEKIQHLVSELGLDASVHFLGVRNDIPELLKMANVAVLSSNHEGLSLSSLEAMASGTPLVASSVTGLKNLVHGAGILFRHKDEIDLAEKIDLLLNNNKIYQDTVANGTKRIQKYTLQAMVESHIALYNDLCPSQK